MKELWIFQEGSIWEGIESVCGSDGSLERTYLLDHDDLSDEGGEGPAKRGRGQQANPKHGP